SLRVSFAHTKSKKGRAIHNFQISRRFFPQHLIQGTADTGDCEGRTYAAANWESCHLEGQPAGERRPGDSIQFMLQYSVSAVGIDAEAYGDFPFRVGKANHLLHLAAFSVARLAFLSD